MRFAAFVCTVALGCGGPPSRDAPARGKPQAPVAAWIAPRDLGHGLHEVTLVGVPATAVADLELELRVPHGAAPLDVTTVRFGATGPASPRALVTRVRLDAAGVDLAGAVRVPMPSGQRRMRPALVRLGAPARLPAPVPTREILLPGGERVAEVRP